MDAEKFYQESKATSTTHGFTTMKRAVNELGSKEIDHQTSTGKALEAWWSELISDLGGRSAHEGHCAVAQKLTPLHLSGNSGGGRFENPEGLETIGPDLPSSFRSQSLSDESEAGDELIKPDRTG